MITERSSASLPRGFSRLAWSNLAAQSAEQIGLAAVPIVAVLALGADTGQTGLLQTAQTLPFLLLAIPAGLLADRTSRRGLMASAEAVRAASLLAVLALAALGGLSVPMLALLGFVGACGTVAYNVATPALVPALVPPAALAAANGRIELARTLAFAAGPALAGALVDWTGPAVAFGVAAVLSTCAAFLLGGLREPARRPLGPRSPLRELREGAAFVFGHPLLGPILLTKIVMVAGALSAPRMIRALPFGVVIALGPVTGFVAAVVMTLTIWIPSSVLAALSFFLIGAGPVVWIVSTATLRQTVTPRDLLGRVSAIDVSAWGSRPIGAALGGLVGRLYGAETCLVVATLGFLVQALVILASPVPHLVRQPEMVGA